MSLVQRSPSYGDSDEDDDEARENPVNKLPLQVAASWHCIETPFRPRRVNMCTGKPLVAVEMGGVRTRQQ